MKHSKGSFRWALSQLKAGKKVYRNSGCAVWVQSRVLATLSLNGKWKLARFVITPDPSRPYAEGAPYAFTLEDIESMGWRVVEE